MSIGHVSRRGAGAVAPALLAVLGMIGASMLAAPTVLASSDTLPPNPFDIVSDAGEFQTGYTVAAPYNSIYVSWRATTDETSTVTYEMTVDGAVARVVTDGDGYLTITKRIEVPEGRHVVGVTALDAAGNRQPAGQTLDVVVDTVSPTFTSTPLLLLRRGKVTADGYPMRYTWTGTDIGTGLSHVWVGQGPDCCYSAGGHRTSLDFTVEPKSTRAWRIWLFDGVGRSARTVRDGFVAPVRWGATHRVGKWQRKPDVSAIDGDEWLTSRSGDRMRTTADGRSLAWVATTGPTRGRADVLLNGRVVDTVSLYSARPRSGRVVWVGKLPRGSTSKVVIVNKSSRARPTIGVDALLLQR